MTEKKPFLNMGRNGFFSVMFFLSHVSLVCCTSWERSSDRNVLDIELLIVNPAAANFVKNFHDQYPYAAMSLYSITQE